MIVLADADLELATRAVALGGYINAGQVCISVQRVIVDKKIKGDFLDALKSRVEAISVSDNLAQRQRAAILFLIAESQQDPAATQRTLNHFAALFEQFDLEEPGRYWPEFIVASVAAGVPQHGQTVQDLIVEFHKHRLQYRSLPSETRL